MNQKDILPPYRLCFSERMLVIGIGATTLALLGAFAVTAYHYPLFLILVAVVVRLVKQSEKKRNTAGIHGDAHFASHDEIAAAGLIGGGPGIVIGKLPEGTRPHESLVGFRVLATPWWNARRRRYLLDLMLMPRSSSDGWTLKSLVRVPESERNAHVGFHLPTGVGKTHFVLKPSLFRSSENAVVYDPSGEIVRAVAEYRREKFGKKYAVIDPFLVSGVPASDRINVFDLVGPDHPGLFDYANYLANAMVIEPPQAQREPFWHSSTVFSTVFLLLAIGINTNEKYRHLLTMGELLNGDRLQELATALSQHPDPAMRRRAEQILNFRGKTLDNLLACLTSEHGWLDSPAYADVLSESTFRLQDLLEEPMDLYVCVPGHRAKETQPFIRLLLTAVLFTAFESGPDINRQPVRLYLDEIATLGNLELLTALYTQGRKYGLRSASFFQSVAQVAEITGRPDQVQTVRSQFAVELFKAKDYQTAKEVSEWIGSCTEQTVSTSHQWSRNTGWSSSSGSSHSTGRSGGWSESTSTTVSETGVPAIRPEQVLQLPHDDAIMLASGIPPVRVKMLNSDDVKRCADYKAARRYQRKYLWRVRFWALIYLSFGMVGLGAIGLVGIVAVQRYEARQQMPVQPMPEALPVWQFPGPYQPVPNNFNQQIPVRRNNRRMYQ